jgi:DNA-directed RNA polymerase delta subunit
MIKKSRQTVMNGVVVQLMKNYKTMQFDNLIAEMRKHRQMQNVEIRIADVKERI